MQVTIQKVGNSHMITVPKPLLKKFGWKAGQKVEVASAGSHVEISSQAQKSHSYIGALEIPDFDLEKTQQDIKASGYDRHEIKDLP